MSGCLLCCVQQRCPRPRRPRLQTRQLRRRPRPPEAAAPAPPLTLSPSAPRPAPRLHLLRAPWLPACADARIRLPYDGTRRRCQGRLDPGAARLLWSPSEGTGSGPPFGPRPGCSSMPMSLRAWLLLACKLDALLSAFCAASGPLLCWGCLFCRAHPPPTPLLSTHAAGDPPTPPTTHPQRGQVGPTLKELVRHVSRRPAVCAGDPV